MSSFLWLSDEIVKRDDRDDQTDERSRHTHPPFELRLKRRDHAGRAGKNASRSVDDGVIVVAHCCSGSGVGSMIASGAGSMIGSGSGSGIGVRTTTPSSTVNALSPPVTQIGAEP